jgi:hypothetical protein
MDTSLGGLDGGFGVQRVWCTDAQRLHPRFGNHLLDVTIGFNIVCGGKLLGALKVPVTHGNERGLRQTAQRLGMQMANFPAAHDGGP